MNKRMHESTPERSEENRSPVITRLVSLLAIFALAAVAACGGGSGGSSPAPVASAGSSAMANGIVQLIIPNATSSTARSSQFVSAGANSAKVTLNGVAQVFDVSGTSPLCTPSAGGRTCTFSVTAQSGALNVTVTLYDGVAATGNVLGTATGSTTVAAPAAFNVGVDISPVLTTISSHTVSFPNGQPTLANGQSGTGTLTLVYKDPSGTTIPSTSTSAFDVPVQVTTNDTHVTITPASITNANTAISIVYDGSTAVQPQITFTMKKAAATLGTFALNAAGKYTELVVPTTGSDPIGITAGRNGGIWFTEFMVGKIGQVKPPLSATSVIDEYSAGVSNPLEIAAGPTPAASPDPHVWYTDVANHAFGSLDTGLPSPSPQTSGGITLSGGISAGGTYIFLSQPSPSPAVARVNVSNQSNSSFSLPGTCNPGDMAQDGTGNLWIACNTFASIVRLTPATPVTSQISFTLPPGVYSQGIAYGPDNAMWLCDTTGKITRVPLTGSPVTQYAIPGGTCYGVAAGPDGGVWWGEFSPSQVGRIDTTTFGIVEYPVTGGGVRGITKGSDGYMWFTESTGNKIGRMLTP